MGGRNQGQRLVEEVGPLLLDMLVITTSGRQRQQGLKSRSSRCIIGGQPKLRGALCKTKQALENGSFYEPFLHHVREGPVNLSV